MIHRKFVPCQTTEALLAVTEYQDGVMNGILRHPRAKNPITIHSLSQVILILDSLLDLEDCPDKPLPIVRQIPEEENVIASFQIQVLFREFYTWQGRLVWQERNQEASFRSELELMQLLDEILGT